MTEDAFLVKNVPYIEPGAVNPMKAHAVEFFKNGRVQRRRIKEHPSYPYGFLREEIQEHRQRLPYHTGNCGKCRCPDTSARPVHAPHGTRPFPSEDPRILGCAACGGEGAGHEPQQAHEQGSVYALLAQTIPEEAVCKLENAGGGLFYPHGTLQR